LKSVAIITARGGSKRIPKKNIREFCGKPIIAYSIEAAISSGCFDEVMVSTDSEEIAGIAKKCGASVPFMRSEQTSNDYATTVDVLEEVLLQYRKIGKEYDMFACLYPTAPFITAERIRSAMQSYLDSGAESLISVVKFSFPPQRALLIKDGKAVFQYPEFAKARSQDLEPIYHDCGQFYFGNTEVLLSEHSLITSNSFPFILPEAEVQDIDTLSDWQIAESKYKAIYGI